MVSLKSTVFLTLVILLFQSMSVYADEKEKVYFRNCCKKAHNFSVTGIASPFVPCGTVKRVKSNHRHVFKMRRNCYAAGGKFSFAGARNIVHVRPNGYVRTVSRKPRRGIRYCHAEESTEEKYNKPC